MTGISSSCVSVVSKRGVKMTFPGLPIDCCISVSVDEETYNGGGGDAELYVSFHSDEDVDEDDDLDLDADPVEGLDAK